jgi:hypothetical protein
VAGAGESQGQAEQNSREVAECVHVHKVAVGGL